MTTTASEPTKQSWFSRSVRLMAIGLATVFVVVVLAVVWLLSPWGLGFVLGQARQVVADGGGTLVTKQASGSVWGGVRIERLSWTDDKTSVTARGVQGKWQLTDLLNRQFHVQEFTVDQLALRLPPSAEPVPRETIPMPGPLILPVAVSIDQLVVGELAVIPNGQQSAPLKFSNLQAALSYADGQYQVTQFDLNSPWGDLSEVDLQIGADLPHPIKLSAKLAGDLPTSEAGPAKPVTVLLTSHGDLEQLSLVVQARALKSLAVLTSSLRPLQISPLTAADLTVSDFRLQEVDAALPQTAMQLSAKLRTLDEQRQPLPGWSLDLQLENAAPGSLRDGLMPLSALSLSASLNDPMLKPVDRIELGKIDLQMLGQSTAKPARITGKADIDLSEQQTIVGTAIPSVLAELDVSDLDLSQFAGAELKTALSGLVSLQRNKFGVELNQANQSAAERQVNQDSYVSSLPPGEASLIARGQIDHDRLQLTDVRMTVGATELAVFGSAQVISPYRLELGGKIVKLQLNRWIPASVEMPARWRQGVIYGGWTAQGAIEPSPDFDLALNIDSSRLAGQALQATISTGVRIGSDASLQSIDSLDALLRLGKNEFTAKGSLSANANTKGLKFQLDLADPATIDPGVRGTIKLTGDLTGAIGDLRVGASLNGRRIRYTKSGQLVGSLDRIEAKAELPVAYPFAPKAAISVTSRLRNLQISGQKIGVTSLRIKGTPAQHQVDFDTAVAGQKLKFMARGRIELDDSPLWVGTLEKLRSSGKVTVRNTRAIELLVSAQSVRVAGADLTVRVAKSDSGRLSIEQAVATLGPEPAFTVSGALSELPIAQFAGAFQSERLPDELLGLRLSSEFQLAGSGVEDLTGFLSAKLRETGRKKRLRLAGRNEAEFRFELGKLDGDLDLTLPSLAFTRRFTGPDWVIDGQASFAGIVAGTVAKPTYDVLLTATDLSLLQPSLGWRLDQGVLRAQVSDTKLAIKALRLQTGEGKIEMTGQAKILPPALAKRQKSALPLDGRFALNTDRFVVPVGPGQRLILSGKTELLVNRQGLSWRGDMNADEGLIEIAGSGAPSLPDDVEIVSTTPVAKLPPDKDAGADADTDAGINVATLLNINLGENLRIQGGGVNARLKGLLQLKGNLPADPRAEGLVKIVDGSYRAYSQDLLIDDGNVRFNGSIDNPALNIEASRPKLPVTVGVAIRGTALSPRIELFSDPAMSDAEKLSWLVLGVPIESAQGGAQSLALKEAASRLLGQDDGSVSGGGFSDKLGLDTLGFGYASGAGQAQGVRDSGAPTGLPGAGGQTSASAHQEVVTLGKKLSDRLSVSYERGVRGLFNLLRVQYELNKRLSLRAQTGSESAVDLLYFWSFD